MEAKPSPRYVRLRAAVLPLLFAGAIVWLAAVFASPVVVSRFESGHPAFMAATVFYLAGATICHQRSERSFHFAGIRFPVCARCTGLYAGAAIGLAVACAWPRRRARALVERWTRTGRWRGILALAITPAALSWAMEWAGVLPLPAAGFVRAATGVVLGAGVAWAIGLTVDAWLAADR